MILRYTCTQCGLVTRVREGQDYKACACPAPMACEQEPDTSNEPVPDDPEPEE